MNLLLAIYSVSCMQSSFTLVEDTIPPCIIHIKTETGKLITKYEYKGQYWYAFRTPAMKVIDNTSDKMTTITFYDSTCHVVGRWTKGGIAGLNRVTPDSIDKTKIKPLWAEKDSAAALIKNYIPTLPDTIQKIALLKKSDWIEEGIYQGKYIYRFQNKVDKPTASNIIFTGSYYSEDGKINPLAKPQTKLWWWHLVAGKYSRTQFRPRYK
jgi:hypothetical protein